MSEEKQFKYGLENFIFRSITIKNDKSCKISYVVRHSEGLKVIEQEKSCKANYQMTETFQETMSALKVHLCSIANIKEDKYQFVNVTGFEIGGKDEDQTFSIAGTQRVGNDQKMSLKTQVIHFEEGNYGIEGIVRDIASDIEMLSYKYIYELDCAQSSAVPIAPPEED